ncbi:putative membrane protein [Cellulomonas cellasea]|uniref:Putative membrane protein n=1 Tax=Cellulomonas cellasea TaxID=43670 RepID=A0A7W4UHU4_9CELL|nr:putative membrane protein [Cellulomonas cellasea]
MVSAGASGNWWALVVVIVACVLGIAIGKIRDRRSRR